MNALESTATHTAASADRPSSAASQIALGAWAVIGASVVAHLCIAPLRRLTFDEAYYACSAHLGIPWPIPQHPPLLGVLLRVSTHWTSLPIELRVRLVPIALSALTSLGVARLAALIAPSHLRERSFLAGAVLASWALMPFAGGVQATPDAPLLASLVWLLCVATAFVQRRLTHQVAVPAIALLSACALGSKMSALPCLAAIALALFLRRARSGAAAVVLGAAAALPYGIKSLLGQGAHALGRGPWVTTSHVGVGGSLAIVSVAVFVVFGPAALVIGARSREALGKIPGGAGSAALITMALVVSALSSGRPPEVHWFAPASLPLYAAAAPAFADMASRVHARVIASHVLPTLAGLVVWCVPNAAVDRGSDFFVTAPHVATSPVDADLEWATAATRVRTVPRYGMSSWRCLYTQRCDDLDRVVGGKE